MFLIDAIKPYVEKKLKTCFILYATDKVRGVGSVQNKTCFISFCVRLN